MNTEGNKEKPNENDKSSNKTSDITSTHVIHYEEYQKEIYFYGSVNYII
jgi:hypothetical protein